VTRKEFDRQRRVLDQSLSAHRHLAERFDRRAKRLILAILILSVLATALAFAGEGHELSLLSASASLPTWAGVLSTVVFALALIDLQVRWGAKAGRHEDGARRLAILKGQFRSATVHGEQVDSGALDLEAEYWDVMTSIEPIPDALFLTLKARHVRKVAQSKLLDGAPGGPVPLIRLKVRLQGIKALRSGAPSARKTKPFLPDESGSPDGPGPEQLPPEARGQGRPQQAGEPGSSGPHDAKRERGQGDGAAEDDAPSGAR